MRGSRNFCQGGGGGGVQVSLTKKALATFFFLVLSLFYSSQINGPFQRNLSFFKVPEWVQHFPGGGGSNIFQGGGVQLLIPYRKPYNL